MATKDLCRLSGLGGAGGGGGGSEAHLTEKLCGQQEVEVKPEVGLWNACRHALLR